jgi:hypothetical protein
MNYAESYRKGGFLGPWESGRSGRTPLCVQQSFKRRDGSKMAGEAIAAGGQPFDTRGWDVTDA